MSFKSKIALLMILSAIQFPCAGHTAEEDRELSLIAAEQEDSDEELDEINPALKESISTAPTQETDKEIKERKKKLKQTRKEKEKINEQKLKDSTNQKNNRRKDETIVIEQPKNESPPTPPPPTIKPNPTPQPIAEPAPTPQPEVKPNPTPQPIAEPAPTPQSEVKPNPTPQPIAEPAPTPQPEVKPNPTPQPIAEPAPIPQPEIKINPTPQPAINPNPIPQPQSTIITPPQPRTEPLAPPTTETAALPNQSTLYANFAEVSRAVKFVPLYMPRKSGYEITAIYAGRGIAEIRYGRRWEPTVSLKVRTHKRAEGEELQDISGVTGVKWRVDTTTGTTLYIAKISDTQQVAAWAVGHYTFSAQAENLSYAGFHSLVADELVELSTHYYLDL